MARLIRKRYVLAIALVLLGALGALVFIILSPEPLELERPIETGMVAGSPQFTRSLSGLYGSNLYQGNAITTLENGAEIFPAMLEAIAGARQSINFETYVYWSGDIGTQFAEALAERASAGVEVNVLLDWQGSIPMQRDLIDMMIAAGAEVHRFRPIHWHTLDKLNNRTHRKLLIVDGSVAFTGGVGIADEWKGDARNPDEFRDLHYRVEGPVVAAMQGAFAFNWIEAAAEPLAGADFFPLIEPAGDVPVQLVASAAGARNTMHLMLMTALASARDTIRIGTAYFVPDELMIEQIIAARDRGVAVEIIVPGPNTNKKIVASASRHFWGELLEAGVEFFEYQPTMYHTKLVIVDDQWATVGSANFDQRSFRLNDEANLSVFDPAFAAEQIAVFQDDLSRSAPVSLEDWRNRPLPQKLTDWLWSNLHVQL